MGWDGFQITKRSSNFYGDGPALVTMTKKKKSYKMLTWQNCQPLEHLSDHNLWSLLHASWSLPLLQSTGFVSSISSYVNHLAILA